MLHHSPDDNQIKASLENIPSNEKEKLKKTDINSDDIRRGSIKNNTHERYYYFADERSDSGMTNPDE